MTNWSKDTLGAFGTYRSEAQRWEVQCDELRKGVTDQTLYAGEFGSGAVVHTWSGPATNQGSVMPGTIAEQIVGTICLGPSKPAELK